MIIAKTLGLPNITATQISQTPNAAQQSLADKVALVRKNVPPEILTKYFGSDPQKWPIVSESVEQLMSKRCYHPQSLVGKPTTSVIAPDITSTATEHRTLHVEANRVVISLLANYRHCRKDGSCQDNSSKRGEFSFVQGKWLSAPTWINGKSHFTPEGEKEYTSWAIEQVAAGRPLVMQYFPNYEAKVNTKDACSHC